MPRVDTDTFYRSALARHGHTAAGVHWNSTRTQRARFEALRRFLPRDLSRLSLVDAGCGFGDLYCFLLAGGDRPGGYIGIDVVEPMVETARTRTGCTVLLLDVLHDPLPAADYYLCSGAMNTLTRDETQVFITRCFAASRHGLVFNLLQGPDSSATFNECLPEDVRKWTAQLDAEVAMADDYLSGDFTTAVTHRPGA